MGATKDIYALRGRSFAQRIFLAVAVGAALAMAWWLLLAGGLATASAWFGWNCSVGDPLRRLCLAVALSVYYVRLLFTEFVFLKRAVGWAEVCMIAPWVFFIFLLFAISGGKNLAPLGATSIVGLVLFALGSWMNSYAEYSRHVWKRRPENHGKLYTYGLFRYSRHPNYLGDLVSFSGLCMISGRWYTIVIPLLMLAGFVFANIPMLDAHLRGHYGTAFDEYAARTRRLIPFIY